jgi:aconitate hydratase
MATYQNLFGAEATLSTKSGSVKYFRLNRLAELGLGNLDKLPFSIKVLLESALRNCDNYEVSEDDVRRLAAWNAERGERGRAAVQGRPGHPAGLHRRPVRGRPGRHAGGHERAGGDPQKINPLVPVDLVIDHSVQVDTFGSAFALNNNVEIEFERNRERYEFLKWGQRAFQNFDVVPPATGIVHQVNLEHIARSSGRRTGTLTRTRWSGRQPHDDDQRARRVGWGVGGIEAEACMLGQPIYMVTPEVVGFKLHGRLPEGATATDLVLTITQILRKHGVVEKFVEFFGDGLSTMSVADRATIANMAPEYGATMGFFPVDDLTLTYMRLTGRTNDQIELVERYCKEQGLWRQNDVEPTFSQALELDLATITPSLAGPKRPQDRVELPRVATGFRTAFADALKPKAGDAAAPATASTPPANGDGLKHGSVTIAAITSCTNTSNPSVMLAAGLVAKNAVEKGLKSKPYVKTSLSPGSRVVTDYFQAAGLQQYLDELGFQTTGYGCMTCIGNSGPLPEEVSNEIEQKDLVVASVLSGNRNFEGRINQHVKANYLASPPLVVAYALAGTVTST